MPNIKELKDRFVSIYQENITRPGSKNLLNYLLSESCDFFVAPASSKHNGAYEGGLCEHSIQVYDCLKDYLERSKVTYEYGLSYPEETIAITALLHDLCKINIFDINYNTIKNENNETEKIASFEYHDTLPYGHGEKSVYIINNYMRLTREEAMAIRWHMGFSGCENKNTIRSALKMYPLALAVHIADMESIYYIEGKQ